MAEIPKSVTVDLDFVISDKTADGFCRLLTDYLTAHPERELLTHEIRGETVQGNEVIYREVKLVAKL